MASSHEAVQHGSLWAAHDDRYYLSLEASVRRAIRMSTLLSGSRGKPNLIMLEAPRSTVDLAGLNTIANLAQEAAFELWGDGELLVVVEESGTHGALACHIEAVSSERIEEIEKDERSRAVAGLSAIIHRTAPSISLACSWGASFSAHGPVVIGRTRKCDLVVPDALVSRAHAQLARTPKGSWSIVDLGSTNGTKVNGVEIKRCELADGDVITLAGDTALRVTSTSGRSVGEFCGLGADTSTGSGGVASNGDSGRTAATS